MRIILVVLVFSFWALAQDVELKVLSTSAPTTAKEKKEMEKKLSEKVNEKSSGKKKISISEGNQ